MRAGTEERIEALLERGGEQGSLPLSDIEELVAELDLDEEAVEDLYERLDAGGVRVVDDEGQVAPPPGYANGELAGSTTDALQLFLNEAGRYPLLTTAQEVELAQRIERGDRQAKELMITSNLRLVVSVAKKYQGHDVPLLDLIQDGIIGLIRAVEKFDWRRGFKFSTYAVWWIRQAVQRSVAAKSRTIRIPSGVLDRERKLARTERELATKLGRMPTEDEVAAASGLTQAQIDAARRAPRAVTSLDRPVGEEGDGATLLELIPGAEEPPGAELEISLTQEALQAAVELLPEPAREVVRLRYGLDGQPPQSIEAVSRRLGVSRERVRQLEEKALERLALDRELQALAA